MFVYAKSELKGIFIRMAWALYALLLLCSLFFFSFPKFFIGSVLKIQGIK